MPATVKANLKPEPNKDKVHAVRLRVFTEQPARYYDTGIRIAKSHWNPKATYEKENWIKDSHHDFRGLNETIRKRVDAFKALARDNPYATASEIIGLYENPPEKVEGRGFVVYCREWIKRKEANEQLGSSSCTHQCIFSDL